jgi:hypothetical protein
MPSEGRRVTARPSGRRLWWIVGLLGTLAVLTVVTIVFYDDSDDPPGGSSAPSTTASLPESGPVPDEELTPALLPAVSALGPTWIETQREDEASEAEPLPEGGCQNFPIPEGWVIRSEQQHTQQSAIVEALSITAGIVAEGVDPPSLDDEAVVGCLLDGLRASLAEGATAEVVEDVAIGPPPAGAEVSHLRIVVTGEPPIGGTFDFVLVSRDRMVSLGLLTGVDPAAATPLEAVVQALDEPLQAAQPFLS